MLIKIARDVQRGIASHGIRFNDETLGRLVDEAMPRAVDMTLRGYPTAAYEIGRNAASVEMHNSADGVSA